MWRRHHSDTTWPRVAENIIHYAYRNTISHMWRRHHSRHLPRVADKILHRKKILSINHMWRGTTQVAGNEFENGKMRLEENLPDIGTAACLVDGRQLVPEAGHACLHVERNV
jgi:hypothetical protein